MINTAREISQMIFPLDTEITIGSTHFQSGFNIVKRLNKQYHIFHISNVNQSYTILPDKHMHSLLKIIFSGMINNNFIEDDGDLNDNLITNKPELVLISPKIQSVSL